MFLKFQAGSSIGRLVVRLIRRFRNLNAALRIYEENSLRRWLIEARIVAGQGDAAIAEKIGVPVGVVSSYATTFFAVRELLEARTYIWGAVLKGRRISGLPDSELGMFWSVVGFYSGVQTLEEYIAAFTRAIEPGECALISVHLKDGAGLPLGLQTEIALEVLPTSVFCEAVQEVVRNAYLVVPFDTTGELTQSRWQRRLIGIARAHLRGEPLFETELPVAGSAT